MNAPAPAAAEPLSFAKKSKVYEVPAPLAPLADTHGHMTCFWDKDPAEVLVRAARAGVRLLVVPYDPVADGMTPREFVAALDAWIDRAGAAGDVSPLADSIFFLAGVHPYGAPDYTDDVHARVMEALGLDRCRGIGEIGLDYHFDADDQIEAAPHDVQISCMERQLGIALERGLPVELHLRNEAGDEERAAHRDAYRVLSEMGVPEAGCVLHCFGEDRACMERFCDLGCYIAFGGASTFKRNDAVREAFAACPLDRVLFETDCPYMAPEPIRGIECEPAMISFTVDALCRDRAARTGEDPAEIVRAAWENSRRLFGCRDGVACGGPAQA